MAKPKIGEVFDGYQFVGGDPNSPTSWTKAVDRSKSLAKDDQVALQAARDQSSQSLHVAQQAERFNKINQKVPTGGWRAIKPLDLPMIPSLGDATVGMFDPRWNEMKGIASAVAPTMRVPGSGASSDTDVKMQREGLPRIENLGPTNTSIARNLSQKSSRDAAWTAFAERWAAQTGTLNGAQPAFNKFWLERQGGQAPSEAAGAGQARILRRVR